MNKNKKLAFTLAEVLIVIGIIGVVAALTLPNLNHATGDKEKVTKVKKIYSALTEAVDRAQAIYGPYNTWFNNSCNTNECFAKRVTEFMKISKDCGTNEGCFANLPLLDSQGNKIEDIGDSYLSSLQAMSSYMAITSDGISLAFDSQHIRADIDGPKKGKNQIGNDIFDFAICANSTEATCDGASANQLYPSARPFSWTGDYDSYAYYNTAWVIENGNLDYLKCPDELNWETKTSCE